VISERAGVTALGDLPAVATAGVARTDRARRGQPRGRRRGRSQSGNVWLTRRVADPEAALPPSPQRSVRSPSAGSRRAPKRCSGSLPEQRLERSGGLPVSARR
jgi:hypothetical protein